MAQKTWSPNETQKAFMEVLANADKPLTLAEIEERAGRKFATGSINTLLTKGLVGHADEVEVEKVVVKKVKVSTWVLADADFSKAEPKAETTEVVETTESVEDDADEDLE